MKILIISQHFTPYISGLTVYAKNLAEGLVKKGFSVTVLCLKKDKSEKSNEEIEGIHVIRIPPFIRFQRGSFSPVLIFKYISIFKKFDIINIHAPFFESDTIALIAKIFGKKKVILTYHCDLSLKNGLIAKTIELLYYSSVKIASFMADKIIMNSMDYARSSRLKSFINKITGIYPPIKTHIYKKTDPVHFRKKYNIPATSPVIGFLGRLVREKGLEDLIRTLAEVKKVFPDIICLLAGEGKKIAGGHKESVLPEVTKLTENLGLKNNITLLGHLPKEKLNEFYSSCDVFVFPSTDPLESFGMVQVEAMLTGCPVTAYDMPGIREVISCTGMGILAPKNDIKKLTENICEILKNKDKYFCTREKIEELFSPEKSISDYMQIFSGE